MDNAIEVTFEGLCLDAAIGILSSIVKSGTQITRVLHSLYGDIQTSAVMSGDFRKYFDENDGCSCTIAFDHMQMRELSSSKIFYQILKYENVFDINIAIDGYTSNSSEPIGIQLMKWASHIADVFNVDMYYGGLEPASDADTRLFTQKFLGPLFW